MTVTLPLDPYYEYTITHPRTNRAQVVHRFAQNWSGWGWWNDEPHQDDTARFRGGA